MKARPILMSGPMVLGLLEDRKTKTRRIIKPQPLYSHGEGVRESYSWKGGFFALRMYPNNSTILEHCPYGKPGDLLWVREGFAYYGMKGNIIFYRATDSGNLNWRPSIHMPRWASRLTLEITDITVERLQDISEEDAIAEGLKAITKDGSLVKYGIPDHDGLPGTDDSGWPWQEWETDPRKAYAKLWNSINGEDAWEENPFVWCLSFTVHHCNVDHLIKQKIA